MMIVVVVVVVVVVDVERLLNVDHQGRTPGRASPRKLSAQYRLDQRYGTGLRESKDGQLHGDPERVDRLREEREKRQLIRAILLLCQLGR